MDKKISLAVIATAVVVGLIGLLNIILGISGVITGAFPDAEGKPITPPIGVGSIFFGLLTLATGVLWVISAIGYFRGREWSSTLTLYVAPAIGAVNIVGLLHLWGFIIHIGWAALSTVAAMGIIWYISKKELASFFLIAVAEHVAVIIIFSMLIYAEPVNTAESQDEAIPVTIETIEPPEPVPPEIIPQERATIENQPVLPKIEIQDITATDMGTEIEDAVPQLPKTAAQIRNTNAEIILRSPGFRDRDQQYQDTVPAPNMESALKSSERPSLDIGPSKTSKDNPETTIARPPESTRRDVSSPDDRIGPSDEVAKPSFAGKISGEIAGRRVVFWPNPPTEFRGTGGGTATIKFWVDPAGSVIKVEINKKSGSPNLDAIAMEYVKQIRFVALPQNVEHRDQWGSIPIDFKLTRNSG